MSNLKFKIVEATDSITLENAVVEFCSRDDLYIDSVSSAGVYTKPGGVQETCWYVSIAYREYEQDKK